MEAEQFVEIRRDKRQKVRMLRNEEVYEREEEY